MINRNSPSDTLLDRLFRPGERWGWETWDPNQYYQPFNQPQPQPDIVTQSTSSSPSCMKVILMCIGGWIALVILGNIMASGSGVGVLILLVVVGIGLLAYFASRDSSGGTSAAKPLSYQERMSVWESERRRHEQTQRAYINSLPLYGTIKTLPGTRRVDVYGGTWSGWESLITTAGASSVGSGDQVTILDLSQWKVAGELCRLARLRNVTVDVIQLPDDLIRFDLLAGFDSNEIKDILVETLYGDQKDGATRRGRLMDDRILVEVCRVLEPTVTIDRILAALRTIIGQEPEPLGEISVLTADEWLDVKDLYKDEARREARERVVALEAQLYPLRGLGTQGTSRFQSTAQVQCIAIDDSGPTMVNDLLYDLLPQLAIRTFRSSGREGSNDKVLIIAGADMVARRHLENLSELAQRRGIRLLYLFKHLRDDAADLAGGGDSATIFMRLGNPEEARRAADHIGRNYSFKLSQLSKSLTSGVTHTTSQNIGDTEGESSSGFANYNRSKSRTWGMSQSVAYNSSQTEGTTTSRVYEYAVEPTQIQGLPEGGFLLVQHATSSNAQPVIAGECNPDLLMLDNVSMEALPVYDPTPWISYSQTSRSITRDL